MEVVDTAQINSFAPIAAQTDFVSPSEEAVFILTASQLKDLIKEAIQPLLERVESLEDKMDAQNMEMADLRRMVASLETEMSGKDGTKLGFHEDIMTQMHQRLAKLEKPIKEPGKTEISRAEKIERYLTSRPDHRATFETLKGHLGIDKVLLNQAIKTLMASSSGRYGITRTPGDKRKRTLVMLPK